MYINKQTAGTQLYTVNWTPKGTTESVEVHVWAKNRLDASNALILKKMWGKQNSIELCFVSQLA